MAQDQIQEVVIVHGPQSQAAYFRWIHEWTRPGSAEPNGGDAGPGVRGTGIPSFPQGTRPHDDDDEDLFDFNEMLDRARNKADEALESNPALEWLDDMFAGDDPPPDGQPPSPPSDTTVTEPRQSDHAPVEPQPPSDGVTPDTSTQDRLNQQRAQDQAEPTPTDQGATGEAPGDPPRPESPAPPPPDSMPPDPDEPEPPPPPPTTDETTDPQPPPIEPDSSYQSAETEEPSPDPSRFLPSGRPSAAPLLSLQQGGDEPRRTPPLDVPRPQAPGLEQIGGSGDATPDRPPASPLQDDGSPPAVGTGDDPTLGTTSDPSPDVSPPSDTGVRSVSGAVELDPAARQSLPPDMATAIEDQLEYLLDPTRAEPLAGQINSSDTDHLHITLQPGAAADESFRATRTALVEAAGAASTFYETLRGSAGQESADQALREYLLAPGGLGERMRSFLEEVMDLPGAGITYHTYEVGDVPGSTAKRETDPRRHHIFEATASVPEVWPLSSPGVILEEPGGFPPGMRGDVQFDFWVTADGTLMLVPSGIATEFP